MNITFNGIQVNPAICRTNKKIQWFAKLPVDWIDWKNGTHQVGTHSLSRTIYILDVMTCESSR